MKNKTTTYRLLAMLAFIFAIGAIGMLSRHFGSLDGIVENETRMREFVQQHPWQGWFLGLAIYTALALVPGSAGKSVVVGWIYGFWRAVLMVNIGLVIAAMIGFFAARFFVGATVRSRFKKLVEILDRRLEKDGAFYLIMMRVTYVPYSLVSYCAGAASVPWVLFGWTTAVGILPGTMIAVFIGSRIPTLTAISESGGMWQFFDPLLWGLLAAAIVLPIFVRWLVGKFRGSTTEDFAIEFSELD